MSVKKNKKNIISLICPDCKSKNYYEIKSPNKKEKLAKNKYCDNCKKHTVHNEGKAK